MSTSNRPTDASTRHKGLLSLLASPQHDSDCAIEDEGPRSRIGTPCTCVTGRLARIAAAMLHAHRPRAVDDAEASLAQRIGVEVPAVECAGDGVLCVDTSENPNAWPCPTVRLIAHAIDGGKVVDG